MNAFPPQQPPGTSQGLEKTPQPLASLSETGLPPASLRLNPKCSSCSTDHPDLPPRSNDPGSDALRPGHPFSLQLLELSPHPTALRVWQPAPPSLPGASAPRQLPASSASLGLHSASRNCYASSYVDLLIL